MKDQSGMHKGKVIYEPISEEKQQKYDERRRQNDMVDHLSKGFTLKAYGRHGTIYYRDGLRLLEIGVEMSGDPAYDMIVYVRGLSTWVLPTPTIVSETERNGLREQLVQWLSKKNIRADLFSRSLSEDP